MATREKIVFDDARYRDAGPSIDRAEALLIFVVVLSLGACGWLAHAITSSETAASAQAAVFLQPDDQPSARAEAHRKRLFDERRRRFAADDDALAARGEFPN